MKAIETAIGQALQAILDWHEDQGEDGGLPPELVRQARAAVEGENANEETTRKEG